MFYRNGELTDFSERSPFVAKYDLKNDKSNIISQKIGAKHFLIGDNNSVGSGIARSHQSIIMKRKLELRDKDSKLVSPIYDHQTQIEEHDKLEYSNSSPREELDGYLDDDMQFPEDEISDISAPNSIGNANYRSSQGSLVNAIRKKRVTFH